MPDLLKLLQRAKGHLDAKQYPKAISLLEQAVRMQPKDTAIRFALGNAEQGGNQWERAIATYERCVQLKPQFTDAWCQLGVIHQQLKRYEKAAAAYQRVLELVPSFAEVACNLGVVLLELGRNDEAADAFRQALAHKPQLPEARNGLGVTLVNGKWHENAREQFEEAIALRPHYDDALFNLGSTLQAIDDLDGALSAFRQIQETSRHWPTALNNIGLILFKLRRFKEAAAAHQKAVEARADYAEACNNLGNDLHALNRLEEAEAAMQRSLELRPGYPAALHNLGNVLLARNHLDEAIESYRRAYADTPMPEAEYSESIALLLKGNFAAGFPKYENRWALRLAGLQPGDFMTPRWKGEPVAGRALLLYGEQGLGDTLQFVRYSTALAETGARVVLYVQRTLCDLLKKMPGVERVVALDEPMPAHDLHCPLLSLPFAFGTELSSIPNAVPYLHAPVERAQEWNQRLSKQPGKKIGIVCSGSTYHQNDHNRSLPLASFKPFAAAAGAHLYLIQKDIRPGDQETLTSSPEITSLADQIQDFSDTAAIVEAMDLVISVDTSLVHLAGAMGKPVWTLLPFPPDWRWLLDRNDSPWYPTMRLFRQTTAGDWGPVLGEVENALKVVFGG